MYHLKRILFVLCLGLSTTCIEAASIPTMLKTDGNTTPLAIETKNPRLTWVLPNTGLRNVSQVAYQVQAASSESLLNAEIPDLWDSGKIEDLDNGMSCFYQGELPALGKPVYWRVRVWLNKNVIATDWSEISYFENGLLKASDWTGKWIGMDKSQRGNNAPYLRGTIKVDKPITSARAYICGLGWCDLYVNGEKIGTGVMEQAQTDYELRGFYLSHDITHAVKLHNTQTIEIGVHLADGWYNQWLAWGTNLLNYGEPKLKAQFIFNYEDGSQASIPADMTWKAQASPITQNNIYRGEVYDARLEIADWHTSAYNFWHNVVEMPSSDSEFILLPQTIVPERIIREVEPISIKRVVESDGETPYMYDFGENITGWVRLKIKAKRGASIRIEFAEKINADGTLFRTSVGNEVNGTVQVDYYTAKGTEEEIWEPRFTFHGFQHAAFYVQGGELLEEPTLNTLTGVVVHSDLLVSGSFVCSDEEINRLHQTAIRTLLAGMHGLPMDCPVRERCGWTGDAHVISKVMNLNFDAAGFMRKFAHDMETGGRKESDEPRVGPYNNGAIYETKPMKVPHMIAPGKRRCGAASPDWGSAIIFIPWDIYCTTGDERILNELYEPMERWIQYLLDMREANGLLNVGLGDWCAPSHRKSAESGELWIGNKEIPITSSIMLIQSCKIMSQIERVRKNNSKSIYYNQLYEDMSKKIMSVYFQQADISNRSQTALSMAVVNVMMNDAEKANLSQHLVAKTRNGRTFDTGIFGTAPMLEVLQQEGRNDLARKLLTKPEYPSYRSMLDMGATTLWEYWPTAGLNGGYNAYDGSMSHPMHAGYDGWFYSGIAGLGTRTSPSDPWDFRWTNDPDLTWAEATRMTLFGQLKSKWQRVGDIVTWEISIPEGQEGNVSIPSTVASISESGISLSKLKSQGVDWLKDCVEEVVNANPVQVLHVGSGEYTFQFDLSENTALELKKKSVTIVGERFYSIDGLYLTSKKASLRQGVYIASQEYDDGSRQSVKVFINE